MTSIHLPHPIPLRTPFSPYSRFNDIKPILITNKGAKLTDYQIKIELNRFNFPFEKIRSDGNDMRFVDADGSKLNYWLESISKTSKTATIWCKIPEIFETSDKQIWMLYGNPLAISKSNGTNTFIAYHGTTSLSFHDDNIIPANSFIYETKVKAIADSVRMAWGVGTSGSIYTVAGDCMSLLAHYNTYTYLKSCNNGVSTSIDEIDDFGLGIWYQLKINYDFGTSVRGYKNDNEINTGITTNLPNEEMGLAFELNTGEGEQEYSFARKYVSIEPIITIL